MYDLNRNVQTIVLENRADQKWQHILVNVKTILKPKTKS